MTSSLTKIFEGLNWWHRIILIINLVSVLILLVSYLAPYISPEKSIYLAYLGLLYPIWLVANFIFIIYWIVVRKWQFSISMFAIIFGILPLSRFIQMTLVQPTLDDSKSFKVMSFNVRVFDLYNWSSNIQTKNKTITFLHNTAPDVICFQEYFRGEGIHFSVKDTLMEILEMDYVLENITVTTQKKKGPGKHHFGSAIFSKYPIIFSEQYEFENEKNNHFCYVDIVKEKDTIRVFNAHLGSMRLQNADYQLIGGDDNKKWAYEKAAKEDLFERMNLAYKKRTSQVKTVVEMIRKSPYPVILCTDLNDTPNSYAYNQLSKYLIDAFVKTGNGIGSTYVGDNFFNRILPVNRIDFIFYSKAFKSAHFTTHQEILSDHKAISCELQLQ